MNINLEYLSLLRNTQSCFITFWASYMEERNNLKTRNILSHIYFALIWDGEQIFSEINLKVKFSSISLSWSRWVAKRIWIVIWRTTFIYSQTINCFMVPRVSWVCARSVNEFFYIWNIWCFHNSIRIPIIIRYILKCQAPIMFTGF